VPTPFVNTSERPWDSAAPAPVRASCRWYAAGGTVVTTDGPRTPFPEPVEPGSAAEVGLDVIAPVAPGRYQLEPAVVEEGVRWMDPEPRLAVSVTDTPARLARHALARARARFSRRHAGPIPKVVHRVWLGDAPLPDAARAYEETWREHHPGWDFRLWRDEDAPRLVPPRALAACRSRAEAANLLRYEVLRRFGGLYVDTDVECRRPLDPLLGGVDSLAGYLTPGRIETAVLASVAGHPALVLAALAGRLTAGLSVDSVEATGPGLMTLACVRHPLARLCGPELMYPYRWDERHRRDEPFPEAFCVHHWDLSWKADTSGLAEA
jgi:inositol phosphorylceramide mannosyltransferase catalytic subunit